jgi:hypothetical protein
MVYICLCANGQSVKALYKADDTLITLMGSDVM